MSSRLCLSPEPRALSHLEYHARAVHLERLYRSARGKRSTRADGKSPIHHLILGRGRHARPRTDGRRPDAAGAGGRTRTAGHARQPGGPSRPLRDVPHPRAAGDDRHADRRLAGDARLIHRRPDADDQGRQRRLERHDRPARANRAPLLLHRRRHEHRRSDQPEAQAARPHVGQPGRSSGLSAGGRGRCATFRTAAWTGTGITRRPTTTPTSSWSICRPATSRARRAIPCSISSTAPATRRSAGRRPARRT